MIVQHTRFLTLALLLSVGIGSMGKADEVDEAAKCSATFRILTSLEAQNEALGQHFTKLALFSYDLMGLYSEIYRNKNMTNGQFWSFLAIGFFLIRFFRLRSLGAMKMKMPLRPKTTSAKPVISASTVPNLELYHPRTCKVLNSDPQYTLECSNTPLGL